MEGYLIFYNVNHLSDQNAEIPLILFLQYMLCLRNPIVV